MARVARSLLPMLMLCYFIAYLDRVNIEFAGLTMNRGSRFLCRGLRLWRWNLLSRLLHFRDFMEAFALATDERRRGL